MNFNVLEKNKELVTEENHETNSVLKLREIEISQATKQFRARGFKLIRCHRCLITKALCVCNLVPKVEITDRFLLLMYHGESIKPSNTGRLIAEILPNTLAFKWDRVSVDEDLLSAIEDPNYQSYIVFPSIYKLPEQRVITQYELLEDKQAFDSQNRSNKPRYRQYIILDGTWSEAKKMFRKSKYLTRLPMLSIDEMNAHAYKLREASRTEQLGTVSVALSILASIGEVVAYSSLHEYANVFIERYLSVKSSRSAKLETEIASDALYKPSI